MAKRGRKSKLTPETQEKLCQAIQLGATYELACQYAGVSYDAFNDWINAGIAEKDAGFVQFLQAIKEAEARGALGWLAKIEKAANDGNWQAAAWKLERRYPQEYGRTVQDHNIKAKLDLSSLPDEELERIARGDV